MTIRMLAALAVATGGLALASLGTAATPKLAGVDGPGFTITLKMNGAAVKKLKAGKYTLVVSDKSAIHNFHLIGPGVNKMVTTVPFTGTKTVTVTLKKGKYTYQCDPHAAGGMKGTFTVS
jgi:plastocyanin